MVGQFAKLRRAEQLVLAYLLYTSVMGITVGVQVVSLWQLLAINACFAGAFLFALSRVPRTEMWRDFLPYPLGLLCYREAGWLASAIAPQGFEQRWVAWDRIALDAWHGRAAIESLGPVLPTVLEAAYLSIYVIGPVAVIALYLTGRREAVDRLWVGFLLGLMLSYIQFPFWPSQPPRTLFPGVDLPGFAGPLRRLNLLLVGNYGIHSSVFPSAHVSGAVSGALMLRRIVTEHRWFGNAMLALAVLIAMATVYGRYHYLVDALAGAAVGVLAYRLAGYTSFIVESNSP